MESDRIAEHRSPSATPAPTGAEVHVWRIEVGGEDPRAAARAALAAILADYLGGDGVVEFEAGADGKPRLVHDAGRLSFNLAHSGGLALVAVAPGGTAVGVDVEEVRPRRDLARLAERWLPAADAAAVAAAPDVDVEGAASERERIFHAAWTRLEARVKCTGAGLAGAAPGPEVVAHELAIDPGYAAAVALAGVAAPRIELRRWEG
jgi:4'-phosphopantetheinyl transferase